MRYLQRRGRNRWPWIVKGTTLGAVMLLSGGIFGVVDAMPASASTIYTVSSIGVGNGPVGVSVDPATGNVYVANSGSDTVSVINGTTVTSTLASNAASAGLTEPYALGTWHDPATGQEQVIITDAAGKVESDYVYSVDAATGEVIWKATVAASSSIDALAIASTGALNGIAFVASGTDHVWAIDAHTGQVLWQTANFSSPDAIAVDPTTNSVYVANSGSNSVEVLNGITGIPKDTIGGFSDPTGVAVDPASGNVYVANSGSNTVSVISDATDTVTSTLNGFSVPTGMAVDPATGKVYVANSASNTVSVISEAVDTVTNTIRGFSDPIGVAVDPVTGKVYVTNFTADTVSVISEAVADTDLSITQQDITFDATTPKGAAVSFTPTVTDPDDATIPTATCTPSSGSMFAIGTTTVTCAASDANETANTTFTVTVEGAAAQLVNLGTQVQNLGPGTSLAAKISATQQDLAAGNVRAACNTLAAFTHEITSQSGKLLSQQSGQLTADTQRIENVLGC